MFGNETAKDGCDLRITNSADLTHLQECTHSIKVNYSLRGASLQIIIGMLLYNHPGLSQSCSGQRLYNQPLYLVAEQERIFELLVRRGLLDLVLCSLKMLQKRKSGLSKNSSRARAAKVARNQESSVHAELRRQQQAQRQSILRTAETPLQARVRSETQAELYIYIYRWLEEP
ncbi:hypothetical protein TNCV_1785961 [Trichonephila clavipes]|nr:hypothetical protein TNCV_1785961 [Trichonephila clavipes]